MGAETKRIRTETSSMVATNNAENAESNSNGGQVGNGDKKNELSRDLGKRQIQMIAIGGTIGTALFVSIGGGLVKAGPAGLLIAYILYPVLLGLVNNCLAEMTVYMPVTSSFIQFAAKWVDPAFGFMAGWNLFLYQVSLIPFEITALNLVLTYWRDDIPVWAVSIACIILFGLFNVIGVKYYGEVEFWMASGKFLLIIMLFCFTFITMIGGNPRHDAYGFRYWRDPGAFATYVTEGSVGYFEGCLGGLFSAAFTCVGPEYLGLVAGETMRPRTYLKAAFKTMYWRFGFFFFGAALCVGIVLPSNDAKLVNADTGTANGSPFVIAMQNLGISVFPDITNALMVTSIFSAGNAYTYCAMRSLMALAQAGHAPKIFEECNDNKIPIYSYVVVMCFSLLSLLQISNSTAQVVTWFANLTEASQLINYIVICATYLFFKRAMEAQGIDRNTLPYVGRFQPHSAWIGLVGMTTVVCCYGYTTFLPGWWDVGTFFSYYTMVFVAFVTFFGWKIFKRTRFVPAAEADLIWDKPKIDEYENSFTDPAPGFWDEIRGLFRIRPRREGPAVIEAASISSSSP